MHTPTSVFVVIYINPWRRNSIMDEATSHWTDNRHFRIKLTGSNFI